jgi:hypothetical protein
MGPRRGAVDRAGGIRCVDMPIVGVGLHLWSSWLQIASEHALAAEQQRTRSFQLAQAGEDPQPARTREMQNAMVAISSSAHAIEALYGEIKSLTPPPRTERPRHAVERLTRRLGWRPRRPPLRVRVFQTMQRGCALGDRTNRWPGQLKTLYRLRRELLHHALEVRPPVPHPGDPTTAVSQEMADYTLENAHHAVDLACDVALVALEHPVAPDLKRWATSMGHWPNTIRLLHDASRSHPEQHAGDAA